MYWVHHTDAKISDSYPEIIIAQAQNGDLVVGRDSLKRKSIVQASLELTVFPAASAQGASSYSELDLVVKTKQHLKRFPLIAHQEDWCLKHAVP